MFNRLRPLWQNPFVPKQLEHLSEDAIQCLHDVEHLLGWTLWLCFLHRRRRGLLLREVLIESLLIKRRRTGFCLDDPIVPLVWSMDHESWL
jgi:hypothetical protein